ncbi:MAG: lipopolysaccharide biosynthesis protein [Acidimicrobiales bacterium]
MNRRTSKLDQTPRAGRSITLGRAVVPPETAATSPEPTRGINTVSRRGVRKAGFIIEESKPRRSWRPGRLLRNAVALMISSVGTAVLGVVFWGVATRLVAPSNIGRASAEIAAMSLLANVAQLGLASTYKRFMPIAGRRSRTFVVRGYEMCVAATLVLSIIYVACGFARRFIPSTLPDHILFVIAVALWAIFLMQDDVLISLRAARWVPVENVVFSLAKLALLPMLVAVNATRGVYLSWMSPVVVAVFIVNWYLFRRLIPEHSMKPVSSEVLPSLREIALLGVGQYATSLLSILSTSLITLIVIAKLGASASAYYYLPAVITAGIGQLLWNVVTSFLVEASTEPEALRHHVRVTVRAMAVVLIPGLVLGEILAPEILRVFGPAYASHGTTLLRLLLLALLGTAVTDFYSSLAWIDKRVWWMAAREFVSFVILIGVLLACIGHFGIIAAGIAALVSSGTQALFFLPITIRRYRAIVRGP